MTELTADLDVFLRGTRTYVQGSQILGRTAEWLGSNVTSLQTAKFTTITQKPVLAARSGSSSTWPQIGSARYATPAGSEFVTFYERPGDAAPRIADVASRISEFDDHGGLNGTCRFTIEGSHEDYLAAVIEHVKALHNSLGRKVEDIWFTALASASLPVSGKLPREGRLLVTPLLARYVDGRRQTLSQVATETASGSDATVAPFNIAFSCLVKED